ncbi:AAA family ATPase [Nakamurella lactea]|uniref:AAA family ATPase n=1 Tax=Nakamurella lactea TaxID=459515 RepID=UPI000423C7C0|nr:chromosome partitioning protein [Nakamurella lactea]
MTGGVATAGSGHDWENELVSALGRPGASLSVVRRCVDVADLLAVAGTGQAAVVVVAADLRRLTSDAVQRLATAGVAVVGVYSADDQRARVRLERIGVTTVVADDAGPEALADAARTAVLERTLGGAPGTGFGDPRSAVPWPGHGGTDHPDMLPPNGFDASEPERRPGRVIAVWGPTGAPGRTTVALNLAAEIAESGAPTLLIDADTYGGVIANALGLLDESPGLAGACRMAANGRLDAAQLAALSWQVGPIRVLTGIARTDRWPEVRASAIPGVLAVARTTAATVVVDCGFGLEADEEITFDTAAPRRNGATLAVLADADLVLAVGSADPPGIERLMRGLADLATMVPDADPRVVLNRQRRSAAGKDEAADAVARFAGIGVLAVLPEDREATDLAWRSGLPLSRAAAGSALRTAIGELARTVAPAASAPVADPASR